LTEIRTERNGIVVSIIAAEHYKNRIHVVGRVWRAGDPATLVGPYEAFMETGEEWTDGYEIEVNHDLENADEDHAEAMTYDEWTEEIECYMPMVLWGEDQSYGDTITEELKELVKDCE
jgi:hypothetical protein